MKHQQFLLLISPQTAPSRSFHF